MKSNAKSKMIILITLGILFAFSPIITTNLSFIKDNSNKSSDYESDLDNKSLQISAVSGKIHIYNNWSAAEAAGICTGNGTYSEPYVIEDLVIDGGGSGNCIWIENSSLYFKIENCTVYNSGSYPNAGILLSNVTHSQLVNNNCSFNNRYGIRLSLSHNNTISGNIANNNTGDGIRLSYSHNNTISGNIANNNTDDGIFLIDSINNNVSGNTANNNDDGISLLRGSNTISGNTANNNLRGISLYYSDNNTLSGNTVNYNGDGIHLYNSDNNIISGNTLLGNLFQCIYEENSLDNIFENNDCGEDDEIIPGYNLFFLFGILSVVAIIIIKKIKKS